MIGYIGENISKLFYVCTGAVVCDFICGSGNFSKANSQAVKMVCSLCVCITVFSFFISSGGLVTEIDNLIEDMQDINVSTGVIESENAVIDNAKTNLENEISLAIFQNYGIKPISVCIDFSVKKLGSITDVTIVGGEIIVPQKTEQTVKTAVKVYAESLIGCLVNVKGE